MAREKVPLLLIDADAIESETTTKRAMKIFAMAISFLYVLWNNIYDKTNGGFLIIFIGKIPTSDMKKLYIILPLS